MSGRVENSLRNIKTTLLIYILNIGLQFAGRTVFLWFLSVEYLGINGLFSNILSMLNLAELGIGSAMVYALYKPCADNDTEQIKELMFLYKKLYSFIGIMVFLLGISLIPFLNFFIDDVPDHLGNISLFYMLYIINTSASYFFTYKRSLIICFQEQYISTITSFVKNIFIFLLQSFVLVITKNYYFYLIVQIVLTILENIYISKLADKKYPYLKEKSGYPAKEKIHTIKKNVMAMSLHKIGGVVVNGTDNLIITKFVSLTATGLFSNYSIVLAAITSMISQIFFALTASVGNLVAYNNSSNIYRVFKRIYFANFMIYFFIGVNLICLFNDFIELWLGEGYILNLNVIFCIVFSFVTNGMRRTVLTFKDAYGLFWNDRFKPLIEVFINLCLSIPLTIKFGIAGTFLGTIVTNLFVSGLIESFVLYKHGFKKNIKSYLFLQAKYYIYFILGLLICFFSTRFQIQNVVVKFLLKALSCILVSSIFIFLNFNKTEEFKYYLNICRNYLYYKRK